MFVTNWISTTKIQKISEITNFFRHYFLSRTEVDLDFCQQFVTYLRSAQDMHHHLKTPKKLAESTILSKIKIFSAVLNEAVRFRLLEENPMGLLHTIHHTARVQKERAFLSQSEIKKVMKAPCAYPLLKEAFSLSILTGLRKSDIFSLKAADLIKRDGIYYIKKTCVKTQQELIIPLSDEAEACLERSTGCRLAELDREKETPLFSALPSSRLNEKLRTWLKEAGITDKHITFHVASHSKFFYLLNISELSILKNVTANDLETSYILFLSQLCNIQRTL